jgi:chaperonin GroES
MDLNAVLNSVNIAESLDAEKLLEIGDTVVNGYEADEESRNEWTERSAEWMKMALQIREDKSFPWAGASNVKYPLITIAALQFAARAYPSLLNSAGTIVKGKVIGDDPDGTKTEQGTRIAKHMTYQILEEMDAWEDDMDRMLLQMSIVGCAFKKTYYSTFSNRNVSDLVGAKDLVVNYYTKSFDDAKRITHILYKYKNDIHSRKVAGIYCDVDLGDPHLTSMMDADHNVGKYDLSPPQEIEDIPYMLLEQHCFFDLDDDGYEEPYVVTVDYNSKKVLRIVARFTPEDIDRTDDGKIIRIKPTKYFTKFTFIPNPDGGFYDLGFGLLLGTINEGANTLLNQLIDAGTLSNLQSGFLSRGIRMKGGSVSFRPGEWKVVNATGNDLKQGIFPMPVREPSGVLFQLLELLISAAKELSTVSDIMVGKMPGQNTPATTTTTAVEEGQKVFTAIYKRLYRALAEEFNKLFEINKQYLGADAEWQMLGTQKPPYIQVNDYKSADFRVIPAADPNVATDSARLSQAQMIMNLIPTGQINPQVAVQNLLEASNIPNIQQLMQVPPPQPNPEIQLKQQELQLKDKWANQDAMIKMITAQAQKLVAQSTAMLNTAKADTEGHGQSLAEFQAQLDAFSKLHDVATQSMQHDQQVQDTQQQAQQQQSAQQQQNMLKLVDVLGRQKQAAAALQAKQEAQNLNE